MWTHKGIVLQIPPGPGGRGYAKARVEVRQFLDGGWRVYHQDRLLLTAPATPLPAGPWRRKHYLPERGRGPDVLIEQLH